MFANATHEAVSRALVANIIGDTLDFVLWMSGILVAYIIGSSYE